METCYYDQTGIASPRAIPCNLTREFSGSNHADFKILVGIQDLLDNPNPDSPAHADAYALFKSRPSFFVINSVGKTGHYIKKRFSLKPENGLHSQTSMDVCRVVRLRRFGHSASLVTTLYLQAQSTHLLRTIHAYWFCIGLFVCYHYCGREDWKAHFLGAIVWANILPCCNLIPVANFPSLIGSSNTPFKRTKPRTVGGNEDSKGQLNRSPTRFGEVIIHIMLDKKETLPTKYWLKLKFFEKTI